MNISCAHGVFFSCFHLSLSLHCISRSLISPTTCSLFVSISISSSFQVLTFSLAWSQISCGSVCPTASVAESWLRVMTWWRQDVSHPVSQKHPKIIQHSLSVQSEASSQWPVLYIRSISSINTVVVKREFANHNYIWMEFLVHTELEKQQRLVLFIWLPYRSCVQNTEKYTDVYQIALFDVCVVAFLFEFSHALESKQPWL